jgi:hypothetical protein
VSLDLRVRNDEKKETYRVEERDTQTVSCCVYDPKSMECTTVASLTIHPVYTLMHTVLTQTELYTAIQSA